jgi:hypothetical protein
MSSESVSSVLSPTGKDNDKNVVSIVPESIIDEEATEKAAFLASFILEEEKKILRKIDYRFLVLIGLMYMIKQVRSTFTDMRHPELTELQD